MSQPNEQPRYVICHCSHCDGHIEFDANELAEENSIVSCPFCGLETYLSIPNSEEITQPASTRQTPPLDGYKGVKVTKGKRVSLTLSQCATVEGQELLALLCEITSAGLVSKEGVQRLNEWLAGKSNAGISAICFLSNIPERFGEFTTEKAFEIHFAIERVLPKTLRQGVKQKRQDAWSQIQQKRQDEWLHSPLQRKATEPQLNYIRGLGGTAPPGINIAEASLLIEQLLGESDSRPLIMGQSSSQPTSRQIMVLRFWDRMDLAQKSKAEISRWMDDFYHQDNRRKSAWELYKLQNGDDGTRRDPSWVKIGEGENCLRDLIAWRRKAGLIFLGAVAVIAAVVIALVHFSKR